MKLSDLLAGIGSSLEFTTHPSADSRHPSFADANFADANFADAGLAVDVVDIVVDHRLVRPGVMFACHRGQHADGHDFASAAIAAGAPCLLVERPLELEPAAAGVVQVIVPDVRAALGVLASHLHRDPSTAIALVGITGTNGKTTVANLVAAVAGRAGRAVGVLGTLGASWPRRGVAHEASTGFTTPEAPVLQSLLATMRDDGVDTVAMEVSSHALDQRRVDGTTFAAVGFTNLSAEHLDLHGTIEAYFAAKARLFTPDFAARAVVCVDDEAGVRLAAHATAHGLAVITVSTTGHAAAVRAVDIEVRPDGSRFVLDAAGLGLDPIAIECSLLGRYNVANACVAALLCHEIGVSMDDIAAGLRDASRVPGRLEPVANRAGFTVVVDYAHTPDALTTVLANLRELAPPPARLVVVYGCGGDRDRSKRGPMGRAVAYGADIAILTSDNPRSERPEAIVADVLSGLDASEPQPEVVLDRRAAIARAIEVAHAGDVVVIAGKGHESGQTANGVTVPFDDRLVAAELLAERSRP